MASITTFPSEHVLETEAANAPAFMYPSKVPYAVTLPGVLTEEECDEIVKTLNEVDVYSVKGCGALTREIVAAPCLDMIETVARRVNDFFFHYDLARGQHSWMQTYSAGGDYHPHMDGSPGQTRKLTAVALLSEPNLYSGGNLTMTVNPKSYTVPRTRGTIVVFQHWIEHEVEPVTDGIRQTINMGFWGPPFK